MKYEKPEALVIALEGDDVIRTSMVVIDPTKEETDF